MRKPQILHTPYLAMWLWLIVPITIYIATTFYGSPHLHLGDWIDDMDRIRTLNDLVWFLTQPRSYEECIYFRWGGQLVMVPAQDYSCPLLQLMKPEVGQRIIDIPFDRVFKQLMESL